MSGTTSVPPIEFTATGVVLPSDSDIQAGVLADMNAAFGGNLNPGLSTPQGQLMSSYAAILSQKNADFAYFMNQIDPANADGFMQDAIGRLYFMTRRPATSTVVQVTCTGLPGVVIPVGAMVQDVNGNVYSCTGAGTIPSSGSITLSFAALQAGPISCPANAITGSPYRAIPGWDRAVNATDGIVGTLVENRADFEYRRQQSVAVNAKGSLPSIYANVFTVNGVLDAYVAENVTDNSVTLGVTNYSLLPHSIYVAVVGGTDIDVATAIWKKKDGGSNYNGNTTVTVQDDSGYSNPIPSYQVTFERPNNVPVYFAISVQNLSSQNSGALSMQIRDAVVSAFNGGDGGQRARIGSTIFASRFFTAIAGVGPIAILSVSVGKSPSTLTPSITMGIDEAPTINPANIQVTFS
jgi:uncharacterized phage protein gp47/JayE